MAKAAEYELKSFEDTDTQAADTGKGIVRMHTSLGDKIGVRRNDLIRITHRDAKNKRRTVYLVCRMHRKLKGNEIALEYDAQNDLGTAKLSSAALSLRRAAVWEIGHYFRGHPDPLVRYAHRQSLFAALVSFVVGLFFTEIATFVRSLLASSFPS